MNPRFRKPQNFSALSRTTSAGKVSKKEAEDHAKAEYEKFAARRREYKEALGEADYVKQLENAAKMIPEKVKRRKK